MDWREPGAWPIKRGSKRSLSVSTMEVCIHRLLDDGEAGVLIMQFSTAVVVKMGREEPAVSMDASGKLIAAKNNDVISAIIKGGK